jgi:hypothetical protein
MMLLRSGYPVPSDLDAIAKGLRGAARQRYADEVRKEVADLLRAHPANSVSDLDHFFTLGVAVKSVWPRDIEFFDSETLSYLEHYVGGGDNAPAMIVFLYGFRGFAFNAAVARVLRETSFSPELVRVGYLQHS